MEWSFLPCQGMRATVEHWAMVSNWAVAWIAPFAEATASKPPLTINTKTWSQATVPLLVILSNCTYLIMKHVLWWMPSADADGSQLLNKRRS